MLKTFLIKHRSSGKFFHPCGGSNNPGNNTSIVLHQDIHDRMHWTFEVVDDYWGYIKHVSSGKVIHPYGGSLDSGNNTQLVLHSDRHGGALFALDAVNDHVVHKGGKYAHPLGGSNNPGNNTDVVLHSDVHDAMRFQFVSVCNPNREELVYGNLKQKMPQTFLIKHRSSGKFFHPYGGRSNPGNDTSIVLHQDIHNRMHWTFEIVEDYWGYIKHVSSGKIIHPSGGCLNPGNGTQLVLHSDRHWGALFALDGVNDHMVQKGGKYAHPNVEDLIL